MRKAPIKRRGKLRTALRWLVLGGLGIFLGLLGYEAIILARVALLRSGDPASTSLIDTRASEATSRGVQIKRQQVWVPLERISPNLQRAILAVRTRILLHTRDLITRLFEKVWDQAQREAEKDAKKDCADESDWLYYLPDFKRGESTISQQLAKNLYLSSQKTFLRKGQEAIVTVFLEWLLTKRRILETLSERNRMG